MRLWRPSYAGTSDTPDVYLQRKRPVIRFAGRFLLATARDILSLRTQIGLVYFAYPEEVQTSGRSKEVPKPVKTIYGAFCRNPVGVGSPRGWLRGLNPGNCHTLSLAAGMERSRCNCSSQFHPNAHFLLRVINKFATPPATLSGINCLKTDFLGPDMCCGPIVFY